MAGVLDSVDQKTQLVGQNRLELLLFKLKGNQIFGINVFKVKEVLQCPKLTMMPKRNPVVSGIAHIREGTIPIIDLNHAIGGDPIADITSSFVIITEYNRVILGFLVSSVERIVNLNWSEVQAPPCGTGKDNYLTAVTEFDGKIVEILDVEKVFFQVSSDSEMQVDESEYQVVKEDVVFKVLVADDSSVARKQMQKCIENVGVETVMMKNGKETLDHLKQINEEGKKITEEYIMLISDIEMPEMDGYTLTAELKSDPNMNDLHIVLHTSLSGCFNEAMIKKVGADDFLGKFQPNLLAEIVVKYIEKKTGVTPIQDSV